jgi:hypothetical protein
MKKNDAPANYFFTPKRADVHFCQAPGFNGLQRYEQANLTARQKSVSTFITAVGDTTAKHREAVLKVSPTLTRTLLITLREQSNALDDCRQISAAIRHDP